MKTVEQLQPLVQKFERNLVLLQSQITATRWIDVFFPKVAAFYRAPVEFDCRVKLADPTCPGCAGHGIVDIGDYAFCPSRCSSCWQTIDARDFSTEVGHDAINTKENYSWPPEMPVASAQEKPADEPWLYYYANEDRSRVKILDPVYRPFEAQQPVSVNADLYPVMVRRDRKNTVVRLDISRMVDHPNSPFPSDSTLSEYKHIDLAIRLYSHWRVTHTEVWDHDPLRFC